MSTSLLGPKALIRHDAQDGVIQVQAVGIGREAACPERWVCKAYGSRETNRLGKGPSVRSDGATQNRMRNSKCTKWYSWDGQFSTLESRSRFDVKT